MLTGSDPGFTGGCCRVWFRGPGPQHQTVGLHDIHNSAPREGENGSMLTRDFGIRVLQDLKPIINKACGMGLNVLGHAAIRHSGPFRAVSYLLNRIG